MINVPQNLPEAIILCGGKGERLRPITNDIPKPLVKIHNKPILHYVIGHLIKYNIVDMVKGDVIFCATGVTDGDLVNGINDLGDSFKSETFVLHKSSNTNKIVKNIIKK